MSELLHVRTRHVAIWAAELWGCAWKRRLLLTQLVILIGFVWWRIREGVLNKQAPLFSWMVLAETAVIIMLILTLQRFGELVAHRAGVRIDETGARGKIASLILQFLVILVGNTFVVWLMWREGVVWKTGDWVNVITAAFALSPLPFFAVLRQCGVSWAWLEKLRWNAPWAKCWYVMALKVFPQVVQAVVIFNGGGRVDFLGVILLAILGFVRLLDASGDFRVNRSAMTAQALITSTIFDFMSVLGIFAAMLTRAL